MTPPTAAMPTAEAERCFPVELLEQLKEQLPQALFATLSDRVATYEEQFGAASKQLDTTSKQLDTTSKQLDTTRSELQYARLKIQVLEEHLRLRRIAKYGPGSEKLSNLQLQLLEEEPGVSKQEVQAESEREALPAPDGEKKRQRRAHPGRQTFSADLPRVEKIVACTAEQCVCGKCGAETKVIGYDESEVLKLKPAEYYVEVTKREKRACKQCEEQGVAMAPLPPRIIDKSLVADEVIIDTIVSKYADHCPLYRQSAILLRDAGIEITRATMCGWVMTVGETLSPVVDAMRRELLASGYIQADETPIDVQTHDKRGKNHQAYLWQYGTPGAGAVFDFRMSRGREGPKQFLGSLRGHSPNRRLHSLRARPGRAWDGARLLLEPCAKELCGCGQTQPAGRRLDSRGRTDRPAVSDRRPGARGEDGSGRTSSSAPGESSSTACQNPGTHPGHEQNRTAPQQGGPGVQLHAGALDEADLLPRPPATGAQQ